MKCTSCGTECKKGEKFCSKCGAVIEDSAENKSEVNNNNAGDIFLDIFKYLGSIFVKPIDTYKNNKDKVSNPVFAFVLSAIVSLFMVITNLVVSIIDIMRVEKYTFGKGYETFWQFSNIKDLNFLELIFRDFFVYAIIILVIAGVFYLSSLVIKKEVNFFKSISITATSIIPFVLCVFVLSPLLTMVWSHFVVINLIGFVYSASLLLNLYNIEISIDGNNKVYYYAVNMSILVLIAYIVIVTLFKSVLLGL